MTAGKKPSTKKIDEDGPLVPSRRLEYQVTASETKEGQEHLQAYYDALGRMVQMFAEAERTVTQTLWYYANTKAEIARIAFAGVNVEAATGYIKQLATVTGASQKSRDDLENVLQQFGIIRGVRNDILHYGATDIAEGRATVSNAWKARVEPTVLPISATALNEMDDDLRKIIAHLGYLHLGRAWPRGALGQHLLERVLQSPWRYKRPSQTKSQTKAVGSRRDRKHSSKLPRQHRSSPT